MIYLYLLFKENGEERNGKKNGNKTTDQKKKM